MVRKTGKGRRRVGDGGGRSRGGGGRGGRGGEEKVIMTIDGLTGYGRIPIVIFTAWREVGSKEKYKR